MKQGYRIIQPSDVVANFIKATTAYGGDDYFRFASAFTHEGQIAFSAWLSVQPKVSGVTLYRGYCFARDYWEDCDVGKGSTIGEDQMTQSIELPAFTSGLIRASGYMNEFGEVGLRDTVKVLFEIRTSGKHFVDISQFSFYKRENEYRCVPNTRLWVESVQQMGGFIKVKCIEQ